MRVAPKLRLVLWLTIAVVALLGAVNAIISWQSLAAFEDVLLPAFSRETGVIGSAVAVQLGRALDLGIPLNQLAGMEEFLDGFLQTRREFAYIALTDLSNQALHLVGPQAAAFQAALAGGLVPGAGLAGDMQTSVAQLDGLMNVAVPVQTAAGVQAWLSIGVSRGLLDSLVADTGWDVVIVLLVCLIVTVEMLVFVVDRAVTATLRSIDRVADQADSGNWALRMRIGSQDEAGRLLTSVDSVLGRINERWERLRWRAAEVGRLNPFMAERVDRVVRHLGRQYRFGLSGVRRIGPAAAASTVRTPLFLAVFAEGLSLSFLPLYAATLPLPAWGVEPSILMGLPITAFMLGIVIATPIGGMLVRRYGTRRIFLMGAVPYAGGYLVTAFAAGLPELLAGRLLSATGYAFITIAAQSKLSDMVQAGERTRSMAVFVGAVMGATACGAAAGAVVADRFGFDASFLLAAALTLAAAIVAWRYLEEDGPRAEPETAPGAEKSAAAGAKPRGTSLSALGNPAFLSLLLFAAIPAKLFLTGVIFYLAPLHLDALEVSQPAIGRTVMSYALIIVLTVDFSAWVTDRYRLGHVQIVLAGLLTGLGTLPLLLLDPATGFLVAIACYGVAQSLSAALLLSVVPDLCPRESRQFGSASLFAHVRLFERIGSIAGPLAAAALSVAVGAVAAVVWIGAICAGAALLHGIVMLLTRGRGMPTPTAPTVRSPVPS